MTKEFETAIALLEEGADIIANGINALKELGVDTNTFEVKNWSRIYKELLLDSGINKVSEEIGEEIESNGDKFGEVRIGDIIIRQQKMPVERLDRYA